MVKLQMLLPCETFNKYISFWAFKTTKIILADTSLVVLLWKRKNFIKCGAATQQDLQWLTKRSLHNVAQNDVFSPHVMYHGVSYCKAENSALPMVSRFLSESRSRSKTCLLKSVEQLQQPCHSVGLPQPLFNDPTAMSSLAHRKKNGIRRQVLDRLALRKAMTNHVCWPSYLAHLLSTWGQNVHAETARFARINSRTSDEYLIPKKNLIFRWASSCLPITGSTFAAQSFRDLCPTDFTSWEKNLKKRSPTHLLFIDTSSKVLTFI